MPDSALESPTSIACPAPDASCARAGVGMYALQMLGAALVCWIATWPLRIVATGVAWQDLWAAPMQAWARVLLGSGWDLVFFLILTAAAAAFLVRPVRSLIPPAWTLHTHLVLAVAGVAACMANVTVLRWLGRPFNFRWFYYSGFLQSAEAQSSLQENLSWLKVLGSIAGCAALLVCARWGGRTLDRWMHGSPTRRTRVAALVAALCAYAVISLAWIPASGPDAHRFANPVIAFVHSVFELLHAPRLFTMKTSLTWTDIVGEAPRDGRVTHAQDAPILSDRPPPKHVILFVAETLGTQYTDLPGGKGYGATPAIAAAATRGAVYPNVYAHSPVTNKTLVSVFCGVYPRISYRFTTADHPDIAWPNLPAMLRARGWRTGFFSGAPLAFQGANNFLAAGDKFDHVEDCEDRPPEDRAFTSEWESIGGSPDRVTVDSALAWMNAGTGMSQSTFAVIWTVQPHYPYFVEGDERAIVDDPYFNRYLNAISQSDTAFGRLMTWIEARGLADSTLVVVVGDHGEAFGQHNNSGHGGQIYQENLQVPLVLIHPRVTSGRVEPAIGGMCDVAPTIVDLLDLPAPDAWDGRSLFSAARRAQVFFFAPWSDQLVGCRSADTKVIYNATADTFEVFDLAHDPGEASNLARGSKAIIDDAVPRMAAWVQHVEGNYRRATEPVAADR